MSFKLDWNNMPSSKKGTGSKSGGGGDKKYGRPLNFLKFTDNSTHQLRPVGSGYVYYRYWYKPAKKYINAKVIVDDSGKVVESNLDQLTELLGCEPEQRFAINVIDRSDNQIKILNGPMGIAYDFAEIAQEIGHGPGSDGGGDWKIKSTGEGKARRYKTRYLGPKKFTAEELTRIKNVDKEKNEWYVLEQIFKPMDMEYVQKLVNGGSVEDEKTNTSTKDDDDNTVEVGTVASPAAVNDDDLDF